MNSVYEYEYEWDSKYCYPNSFTLINKLNIQDPSLLNDAERKITATRLLEIKSKPIPGSFDLKHLQAIHKYLFQDIYSWAGELRTVNIAKGNQFCNCMYMESGFNTIYSQLKKDGYLIGIPPDHIYERLAYYLGELNVIHPFREGNGRAQRVYIESLANISGYHIDFSDITGHDMIEASADAFKCHYGKMIKIFEQITTPISMKDQINYIQSIMPNAIQYLKDYTEDYEIDEEIDMTLS